MSKHLFGLIVTPHGTAANNRGETEGNITTLQKILWNGEVHTSVSAEAIRWAIRYSWQRSGKKVNRVWDDEASDHKWQDEDWLPWTDPHGKGKGKETYIDDDVMGFMLAEAGKTEGSEAEAAMGKGKKKQRVKGTCDKRRGALEVTRALSLTPFSGDVTFNAKSGEKTSTSLYGTEVHATRYQYGFALTPEWLREKSRTLDVVEAIVSLSEVAGNQSRFLYDFSPDTVIFRWTEDFAPRFLYGFRLDGEQLTLCEEVLHRIKARDINPKEFIVGGTLSATPEGKRLKEQGSVVLDGIKAAAEEVKRRIRADLAIK